jgi:ABC-type Fe3+ transport system permease subunit
VAVYQVIGRNGLVTHRLLADGVRVDVYRLGFDLFSMTGLVFVQTITYFSVAYLILRGMLERFNPAMDEAAENLGASKRWLRRHHPQLLHALPFYGVCLDRTAYTSYAIIERAGSIKPIPKPWRRLSQR